jgi:prepilin-type N-terminal cleavage/methylation domain-containing protein
MGDQTVHKGFTLAELLIALAILGLIATFTIPKIVSAQRSERARSGAKETAAMLSTAYQVYLKDRDFKRPTVFYPSELKPYFNYASIEKSEAAIDSLPTGWGGFNCNTADTCYRLHNGAVLAAYDGYWMDATNPAMAVFFYYDPDGINTYGSTTGDGPGRALFFALYGNGRIRTMGSIEPSTSFVGLGTYSANPALDPSWFSW